MLFALLLFRLLQRLSHRGLIPAGFCDAVRRLPDMRMDNGICPAAEIDNAVVPLYVQIMRFLRFCRNGEYITAYLYKHFRLFELLGKFIDKLVRQAAEAVAVKTAYQERLGDNVINPAIVVPKRTV